MKRRVVPAVALSAAALAWAIGAQTLGDAAGPLATVDGALAILNEVPELPDDPLLDASGNVVVDAFGNPVSDPHETFHTVKPRQFDPAHTDLVQAAWLTGTGCPTGASIAIYPATSPNGSFTDPACATGDPKDQ